MTIQEDFPLSSRPYSVLAAALGTGEDEIFRRVSRLKRRGVIRRLGPLFDSRHLGFRGHLIAVSVSADAVDRLAERLDRRDEVTHNYLRVVRTENGGTRKQEGRNRSGLSTRSTPRATSRGRRGEQAGGEVSPASLVASSDLSVWFTAMLREGDDLEEILRPVRQCPGVSGVRAFRSLKVFKLDARFEFPRKGEQNPNRRAGEQARGKTSPVPCSPARRMGERDNRVIAGLVAGLPDSMTPYADAARALGMEEKELLLRLERMRASGVLRRVRAVLDQKKLGFRGNVLVAWKVPARRAGEVGKLFASRGEVSHCVLRTTAQDFPYNLYTMIHAETTGRARAVVREMERASGIAERVLLETVRELKKTPPRYFFRPSQLRNVRAKDR